MFAVFKVYSPCMELVHVQNTSQPPFHPLPLFLLHAFCLLIPSLFGKHVSSYFLSSLSFILLFCYNLSFLEKPCNIQSLCFLFSSLNTKVSVNLILSSQQPMNKVVWKVSVYFCAFPFLISSLVSSLIYQLEYFVSSTCKHDFLLCMWVSPLFAPKCISSSASLELCSPLVTLVI